MREPKDGNNTLTYVLPAVVDPPEYICVTLRIPNERHHIMAFKGAIWDLCNWWNWERDDSHTGTLVARVWRKVFRSMVFGPCPSAPVSTGLSVELPDMSDLVQVVCDSDGNCILQFRCDVCSPWQTAANVTAINPPVDGTGNQPPAGGGTANYCQALMANGKVVIPTPVNTGDTIQIVSFDGSGTDGSGRWTCGEGDTFFISCTGIGEDLDSGDPVPTATHMSFIVNLAGTFYALKPYGTPFVVPSGIVNIQPEIQVNDSDLTNNGGDYNICVKVTNNKVATYCHDFDNAGDLGTWQPVIEALVNPLGAYFPGQGWQAVNGSFGDRQLVIKFSGLVGLTITSCTVNMTAAGVADTSPQLELDQLDSTHSGAAANIGPNTVFSGNSFTWSSLSASIPYGLVIYYNAGSPGTASLRYITSIVVRGTYSGTITPSANC